MPSPGLQRLRLNRQGRKDFGANREICAGVRSDRDSHSAPTRQKLLVVMIGAPARACPELLSARDPRLRAKGTKKKASQGFHPLRSLCGNVCSPSWLTVQGHALSGAVREDRGLATEHRELRGTGPLIAPVSGHQNLKNVPRIPIGAAADHTQARSCSVRVSAM